MLCFDLVDQEAEKEIVKEARKVVEKNTYSKDTRYSGSQTGHGFMVTFKK
jgi:hypothetical protein